MTDEIIDLQDFRNRIKPRVIFGIIIAIVILFA
ncbi:MAG: hypothetical protein QG657_399, partial [Acidobacteriota bacterium]|nr:hypothetical protein [Acidobacteriota bacterium]